MIRSPSKRQDKRISISTGLSSVNRLGRSLLISSVSTLSSHHQYHQHLPLPLVPRDVIMMYRGLHPAFLSAFSPRTSLFHTPRIPAVSTRPSSLRHVTMQAASAPASTTMTNADIKRMNPTPNFNQIVIHNDTVYLSGQIATAAACPDRSAAGQTKFILNNIDSLLEQAGTNKSRVLTASIWVTDVADLGVVNETWAGWIDPENKPARACVQSGLITPDLLVEVQVTAALPPKPSVRIATPLAAAAVGPYAQAVVTRNDMLYISGCIGLTVDTGVLCGETVEEQTHQALSNLEAIMNEAGAKAKDIVKTTVLLADMNDFGMVNGIYEAFFKDGDVPARACFAAKQLPKGALVEIEAIAMLPVA